MPVPVRLLLIVMAGLLLVACHPSITITFKNRTEDVLLVDIDSGGFDEVEPGSALTLTDYIDDEDRIEIVLVTRDGDPVYHEITTAARLKERDNTIVLEQPSSR